MSGDELNEGNWFADDKSAEATKVVRCVIDKDYSEGWKGLGSGDCSNVAQPRRENTRTVCSNTVDTLRLKNHLEWKKQKEIEYMRKREAEKLEEERKKEEKIKEERERRRKEKEREEKVREWQEQKAREKEERKREEMVLKNLEREIKGVNQSIDKEKLIREWIRLKNKQKQMESERKAELRKKEEETRALRQALAEISYKQWKERTKGRRITLPKNGYQIFGPKPAPVVKEAWNHDFINGDNEEKGLTSRSAKSTVSTTSIRGGQAYAGGKLKPTKSKTCVNDSETRASDLTWRDLRLWEMVPDDGRKISDNSHEERLPRRPGKGSEAVRFPKTVPNGFTSKLSNVDALPSKNKLDIYLDILERDRVAKKEFKFSRAPRESNSTERTEKLSARINHSSRTEMIRQNQSEIQTRRSRSFDKTGGSGFGSRSCSASSDKLEKSDAKKKGSRGSESTA